MLPLAWPSSPWRAPSRPHDGVGFQRGDEPPRCRLRAVDRRVKPVARPRLQQRAGVLVVLRAAQDDEAGIGARRWRVDQKLERPAHGAHRAVRPCAPVRDGVPVRLGPAPQHPAAGSCRRRRCCDVTWATLRQPPDGGLPRLQDVGEGRGVLVMLEQRRGCQAAAPCAASNVVNHQTVSSHARAAEDQPLLARTEQKCSAKRNRFPVTTEMSPQHCPSIPLMEHLLSIQEAGCWAAAASPMGLQCRLAS